MGRAQGLTSTFGGQPCRSAACSSGQGKIPIPPQVEAAPLSLYIADQLCDGYLSPGRKGGAYQVGCCQQGPRGVRDMADIY